jgi:hypothetical protein
MFVSEVLQTNAYRVLRLSASATYSDVHKAADSFKRLNTLGLIKSTEIDLPQLGPVTRSESNIRSAVNRMETPAWRLQDRLFWFHLTPKRIDQDTVAHLLKKYHGNSEALAALSHDDALHAILAAVVSELDEPGTKLWVQALQQGFTTGGIGFRGQFAQQQLKTAHVRFVPKADIALRLASG